jgi:hypothetical protein
MATSVEKVRLLQRVRLNTPKLQDIAGSVFTNISGHGATIGVQVATASFTLVSALPSFSYLWRSACTHQDN